MNTLTIPKKTLAEMLRRANSVLPSRAHNPMFENMVFGFDDGKVRIESFSFENTNGMTRIACEKAIDTQGSTCFAARFRNLLKSISIRKTGDVHVYANGTEAMFQYGRTNVRIVGEDRDELPTGERIDGGDPLARFTIPRETMVDVINCLSWAASNEATRSHLMGLYIEIRDKGITVTATNGHVLLTRDIDLDVEKLSDEKVGIIIPVPITKTLKSFLGKNESDVTVTLHRTWTQWKFGNKDFDTTFDTPNIDETYSNYRAVIDTFKDPVRVAIDTETVLSSIKEIMPFVDSYNRNGLILTLREDGTSTMVLPPNLDNPNSENVEAAFPTVFVKLPQELPEDKTDAVAFRVKYNIFYLRDMLRQFSGEIHLACESPNRAAQIKHRDYDEWDDRQAGLIMPVLDDGMGFIAQEDDEKPEEDWWVKAYCRDNKASSYSEPHLGRSAIKEKALPKSVS